MSRTSSAEGSAYLLDRESEWCYSGISKGRSLLHAKDPVPIGRIGTFSFIKEDVTFRKLISAY